MSKQKMLEGVIGSILKNHYKKTEDKEIPYFDEDRVTTYLLVLRTILLKENDFTSDDLKNRIIKLCRDIVTTYEESPEQIDNVDKLTFTGIRADIKYK